MQQDIDMLARRIRDAIWFNESDLLTIQEELRTFYMKAYNNGHADSNNSVINLPRSDYDSLNPTIPS